MKIKEAVAAETAMVEEKIIRNIAIFPSRKFPNKAKNNENNSVVGTVYATNKSDFEMLLAKTGVAHNF